jgi:hypothetical protein
MTNIVDLQEEREKRLPHVNTMALCLCGKQWLATHPVECTQLECPGCHRMCQLATGAYGEQC